MIDTRPILAHDADIYALAEGRTPLRRGIALNPGPGMAADAMPTRAGSMPALPLTTQESSMDETEVGEKVALLLQFLQPKLDDNEMAFVRSLFGQGDDTADPTLVGMDRAMRARVVKARREAAATLAQDRAAAAETRAKRFPHFNRLG